MPNEHTGPGAAEARPTYEELRARVAQLELQAQAPASAGEAQPRGIFENLQDAYFQADVSGRFTVASPSAPAMFGYASVEEMIRLPAASLYADPAARDAMLDRLHRSGRLTDFVTLGRRKDGTTFGISMNVQYRWDASGRIVGTEGVVRDISEREAVEAALRQSEELSRRIIESSYDCIKVLDLDGRLLSISPGGQRLLEIADLNTVLGKSWLTFWHGTDHDEAAAALATARAGGTGRLQGYCPTAKGKPMWWDVVVSPLAGGAGQPERLLAISRDVTERRRAEDALREADRRKDEFLAVLSHELRNPLAPIRNSVLVLQRAVPGGEQALRAQQIIERQSAHLARLVDDLLDLNRISRGKVELQRERVDLADLAALTAEDHRANLQERGIALDVEIADAPQWLDADPTRVAQVVGNLLVNAGKFTPWGGRVLVRVAAEDGRAVVRVRDTGAGLTPDLLEKVFEPFTQAEQTLARSHGGLGLGLALVKAFVEMHGGNVAATSGGPGRGAEFIVRLPLLEPVAGGPAPPAPAAVAPALRVLVVEDNRDAADSLRDVLALLGHEGYTAYDGASGIALARERVPDLVLCDVGLPDMDGYAVARALRAETSLAACCLVALTGYAQPDDVARARAAGFDDHLAKPPRLERLRALLERAARPAPDAAGAGR